MAGMEAGVDRVATLSLMRRLDDYRKGILRSILAGAVRAGVQLLAARLVDTDICPHCQRGHAETLEHMWWECPAWASIRRKFEHVSMAYRSEWPRCFSSCGIMPANHDAFLHLSL
eukprot:11522410-Karenia_brevis.AAC.1